MPPSSSPAHVDAQAIRDLAAAGERLRDQIEKAVVGQKVVIEQLLTALFARGHCLLVGVPGTAKILLVGTVARVLQLAFHRIQFTPDLLLTDVTGEDVLQNDLESGKRRSVFHPGPLFANVVLATDINQGPPKVQGVLFEAMQEGQVKVGDQTYRLPDPFFALAYQNPIEQEQTYPLSEAQLDRFLFSIHLEYPSRAEEIAILKKTTGAQKVELTPILDGKQLARFQEVVRQVVVADQVFAYTADLVRATRPKEPGVPKFVPELVQWGAGPRASQGLIVAAKARAALHGRFHATTEDVRVMAPPVLRHRLVTTFNADAEGITPDAIVGKLLDALPPPNENSGPKRK
jgi:MoxR-like ATPase